MRNRGVEAALREAGQLHQGFNWRLLNVSVAWKPQIMQLVQSTDLPAASSSRA